MKTTEVWAAAVLAAGLLPGAFAKSADSDAKIANVQTSNKQNTQQYLSPGYCSYPWVLVADKQINSVLPTSEAARLCSTVLGKYQTSMCECDRNGLT